MNHFTLSGNLTKEPEIKYTTSGKTVINFSIANNDDRRKKEDGSFDVIPSFFDVTFWTEKTAYWVQTSRLAKGNQVVITGRIQQQRWQNSEGQTRSRVVFIVQGYPLCIPKQANINIPDPDPTKAPLPEEPPF